MELNYYKHNTWSIVNLEISANYKSYNLSFIKYFKKYSSIYILIRFFELASFLMCFFICFKLSNFISNNSWRVSYLVKNVRRLKIIHKNNKYYIFDKFVKKFVFYNITITIFLKSIYFIIYFNNIFDKVSIIQNIIKIYTMIATCLLVLICSFYFYSIIITKLLNKIVSIENNFNTNLTCINTIKNDFNLENKLSINVEYLNDNKSKFSLCNIYIFMSII